MDEPKFLAIKNWSKYQREMHKRDANRPWIKDYIEKDNDPDYAKLTCLQRYVLDGCCRLRGRFARNLYNDPTWVARALHVVGTDAPHVAHAIRTLIARGFLILCNQQIDSREEIERERERRGEENNAQSAGSLFSGEPIPAIKTIVAIPLNDGSDHSVTEAELAEWQQLYPAVDVLQELRKMRGWAISNSGRRKTARGVKAFINSWLSRAQDGATSTRRQSYEGTGNGYSRKQTPFEQAQDRIRELQAEIECDRAEAGGGVRDSEQAGAGKGRPEDFRGGIVTVH